MKCPGQAFAVIAIDITDIAALASIKNIEIFFKGWEIRVVIHRASRFQYQAEGLINTDSAAVCLRCDGGGKNLSAK